MALGLLILRAIGLVPYLGVWVNSLVICLGLGAMVLAIYRYMRPNLQAAGNGVVRLRWKVGDG